MIHIEKNQKIAESEGVRVATDTGDYEDSALIEVYNESDPSSIIGAFQAQYVKYGNLVYGFNDSATLGAAILAVDPEATHTAAAYVRMTKDLSSQMDKGTLEQDSLDQVISDEKQKIEETVEEEKEETEVIEEAEEETEPTTETPEENPVEVEEEPVETPVDEPAPEEPATPEVTPIEEVPIDPVEEEAVTPTTTEEQPLTILRRRSKKKIA